MKRPEAGNADWQARCLRMDGDPAPLSEPAKGLP
ncbi:MAG: hypothetical protein JWP52_2553 [Rhizobacter sp.]|jgi:hypothetical protein|nr:hypothetical protein [Rhizobacter sp.]